MEGRGTGDHVVVDGLRFWRVSDLNPPSPRGTVDFGTVDLPECQKRRRQSTKAQKSQCFFSVELVDESVDQMLVGKVLCITCQIIPGNGHTSTTCGDPIGLEEVRRLHQLVKNFRNQVRFGLFGRGHSGGRMRARRHNVANPHGCRQEEFQGAQMGPGHD